MMGRILIIWIVVAFSFMVIQPAKTDTTFTEDWSGNPYDRWDAGGDADYCVQFAPGLLSMHCQAGYLKTKQSWSFMEPVTIEAKARCAPERGNRCTFGLIVFHLDDPACDYKGLYFDQNNFFVIDDCKGAVIKPYDGSWHALRVEYIFGKTKYYIDGVLYKTFSGSYLEGNPSAMVLCTSVDPGQVDDSLAFCEVGTVTVRAGTAQPWWCRYVPWYCKGRY